MANTSPSEDLRAAAARFLTRDGAREPVDPSAVGGFLDAMGYGGEAGESATAARAASLLHAASRLDLVFRLHWRAAPGLSFFGGVARASGLGGSAGASLNGAGETPREAFEACVGEGVEYLSQIRRPGDAVRTGSLGAVAPWRDERLARHLRDWLGEAAATSGDLDWVSATRLSDGAPGWLPAPLVLREAGGDSAGADRFSPGCGCAAGPTWEAALAAAFLEAVERDAVAFWWRGGRPGRPIAVETLIGNGTLALIERVRQGRGERVTTLLDISGDRGIPCVAALSFDRADGGFAVGFGCAITAARAGASAVTELCQMELGREIVAAKRARLGADTLNDADRRLEKRGAEVRWNEPGLVDGLAGPISLADEPDHAGPRDLADAIARLAASGFEAYAVDLTRAEFGIPVARVVVAGLQPYPSTFTTSGLAAAMAEASRHSPFTRGIDLF